MLPKFRRDDEEYEAKTSFLDEPAPITRPLTPNERVMADIRSSMERLGISEEGPSPPAERKPMDISRVNPFSALSGSVGAFLIAYVAWNMLQSIIALYLSHPLRTDFYVIQRINAIVRTVVVSLLALASGISGVTALGLALLAGRTGYAAVTRELDKSGAVDSDGNDSKLTEETK